MADKTLITAIFLFLFFQGFLNQSLEKSLLFSTGM